MKGRTRVDGEGRKEKKYKRTATTFQHQLDIINFYAYTGSMSMTIAKHYPQLAPQFQRSKARSIQRWARNRSTIEAQCTSFRTRNMTRIARAGHGLTLGNDGEKTLVTWINLLRKDGVPVSTRMLTQKAHSIAKSLNLPEMSFAASPCWQQGFLQRNRLSMQSRTRHGQTTPEEVNEVVRAFASRVLELLVTHGIDRIYNADQTGVFFEYVPKVTVNDKGQKTVWVRSGGKDKERLTAMLLGDSEGGKYPPFVVVHTTASKSPVQAAENDAERHGFGKAMWKKIKPVQDATGMQLYGNRTAWWNSRLSLAFLNYHFGSRDGKDDPILLLWDDFSGHWTREVTELATSLGVILERVPPKFTYVCQPADISWNQPFKSRLRRAWIDHISASVESDSSAFVYKPPTREQVVEWVADAWSALPKETIQNGFVRAKFPVDRRGNAAKQIDIYNVVEVLESLHLIDTSFDCVESDDDVSCGEASDEDVEDGLEPEDEEAQIEMTECYV